MTIGKPLRGMRLAPGAITRWALGAAVAGAMFVAALCRPAIGAATEGSDQARPPRVLVDLSHCQNGGGALHRDLLRDIGAEATINYGPVSWEVLRNYDAVLITGSGPRTGPSGPGPDVPFTADEIAAVYRFLRDGGGVLVAAHGSQWRGCHRLPMSEMARNQLLKEMGVAFTDGVARGELALQRHPALAESDPRVLRRLLGEVPNPLAVTSAGFTTLVGTADGATVAVAGAVGRGRLIVVGADAWAGWAEIAQDRSNRRLVKGFVGWLGENRYSRVHGAAEIPHQIDPPALFEKPGLKLSGLPALEPKARIVAGWCAETKEELESYLGITCRSPFDIRLLVGDQGGWSGGGHIGIPAFASDLSLVAILGHEMGHSFWEPAIPPAWFNEVLACWVGMRAQQRVLGRADEEFWNLRMKQWREVDADGLSLDLTSFTGFVPPSHTGKGLWVISELERAYGADFIARFERIVRADARAHKLMSTEELVYFLGRAAGDNLGPWFRTLGTTVTTDDPFAQ